MSSSSRVRLTRIRETVFGVLPTPAAMLQIRRTGGSWSDESTNNPSAEVRPDLMLTDVVREDYMVKGSIEDEFVYAAHDAEFQDLFGATISATIALSALTLTYNLAASSIVRSAGSWVTDGIVAGGYYNFGGAINGANNGRKLVLTVSALTITVLSTLVDEVATASCTVAQAGHNRMGTNVYSSVFEEQFPDVGATELWQMLGCVCTGWTYQFSHPGKMTQTFTYEAATRLYNASTAGNGTVTAYTANRVMNSIDHFRAFFEGGASAATLRVKEISLNVAAPKRRIVAAGTLGAVDFGANTFGVTGSVQVYNSAAARAVAAKHRAGTPTSLAWENLDTAGNCDHFYIGGLLYNAGSPQAGPKDGDVYITLPFIGYLDTLTGSMFQRTKIAA